jgi:HK97 family phage major capsid protein
MRTSLAFGIACWRRFGRNPIANAVFGALAILLTIVLIPKLVTGLALATVTPVTRRQLKTVLAELKAAQEKMRGKETSAEDASAFEALCKEAKEIQDEAERDDQIKAVERYANSMPSVALPSSPNALEESKEEKAANLQQFKSRIAGYITPGQLFASSEVLEAYVKAGIPRGPSGQALELPGLLKMKGITGLRQGVVPLTSEQRKAIEDRMKGMESKTAAVKASPVLGTYVIEPDRLADITMVDLNEQLGLRDVLNVSSTTSNLIQWVRRVSFTRAADVVSEGGAKPQASTEYDLVDTAVKVIAAWIPVSEQQLQDAPQIINIVNTDLLWDLRKKEEEQVMWGTSTSATSFEGIAVNSAVVAGRTSGGDTIIDKVRRAITDVRLEGYQPNAIAMHPIDWESVQLTKGSDLHYIYIVTTDSATGASRVWSVSVVELLAMEKPADTDRVIVVGDFMRGATLWDRMLATIAVGWQDDQFIKNMRTIRAEERIAFAVRRPKAFKKIVTST